MATIAPKDIALPPRARDAGTVASPTFDPTLHLLASSVHCYPTDFDLARLSYQISPTASPWPDQTDHSTPPASHCDVLLPLALASSLQLAQSGGDDAVVDPDHLQNIKIEGAFYDATSSHGFTTISDLPGPSMLSDELASSVDSLVQTIQLKSERRPSDLASPSFSDFGSLRADFDAVNRRRARKIYRCSVASCTKTFYQKTHLEIHTRAHNGYKPFVRRSDSNMVQVLRLTPCSVALS